MPSSSGNRHTTGDRAERARAALGVLVQFNQSTFGPRRLDDAQRSRFSWAGLERLVVSRDVRGHMGTVAVVAGSLVAAVLAYVFQVFGGRVLGPEAFAPIGILWTIQFLAMQVLYQPLEHLVNRDTGAGRPPGIRRVLWFGAAAGILTAVGVWLFGGDYVGESVHAFMAGILVFGYALFGYVRGRLAGTDRFGGFGLVTGAEAGVRILLAVAFVALALDHGLGWAMVLAPFVALLWLPRVGTGGRSGDFGRQLPPLVGASFFAQALLGLAPLAVAMLGAGPAAVSIVFLTFAMYRGPLWILQGVMARVLPVFVRQVESEAHQQLRAWMVRLATGAAVLSIGGFVLGATIAPAVFAFLLGEDFRPAPLLSGFVAAGVVIAACGGLMNQVLLALDRLRSMTLAWGLGFAAAVLVTFLAPIEPVTRTALGFLIGEIVAVISLYVLHARIAVDALPEELLDVVSPEPPPAARVVGARLDPSEPSV
jgi:O-antigen/teichoic acid export membrane protein